MIMFFALVLTGFAVPVALWGLMAFARALGNTIYCLWVEATSIATLTGFFMESLILGAMAGGAWLGVVVLTGPFLLRIGYHPWLVIF